MIIDHTNKHENYGAEAWREPTYEEGDTVIFSECGRVFKGENYDVCYRSHWLSLVKAQYGREHLVVKHGGGQERFSVNVPGIKATIETLKNVPSDARYAILYAIYQAHSEAKTEARQATQHELFSAFCEGRLKRKKRNHRWVMDILPKPREVNHDARSTQQPGVLPGDL